VDDGFISTLPRRKACSRAIGVASIERPLRLKSPRPAVKSLRAYRRELNEEVGTHDERAGAYRWPALCSSGKGTTSPYSGSGGGPSRLAGEFYRALYAYQARMPARARCQLNLRIPRTMIARLHRHAGVECIGCTTAPTPVAEARHLLAVARIGIPSHSGILVPTTVHPHTARWTSPRRATRVCA